jgi:hypothetical protein
LITIEGLLFVIVKKVIVKVVEFLLAIWVEGIARELFLNGHESHLNVARGRLIEAAMHVLVATARLLLVIAVLHLHLLIREASFKVTQTSINRNRYCQN